MNKANHNLTEQVKMEAYRIKGINDDRDFCELCGKQDLVKVVWLENVETMDIIHVGTTCAAKLRKIKVKEQKADEKEFIKNRIDLAKLELRPLRNAALLSGDFSAAVTEAHSDRSIPWKLRMENLRSDERYIAHERAEMAYKTKAAELAQNIGCDVFKLTH